MSDSNIWTIDRIAAANVARSLGIELADEQIETVTRHMAAHRSSVVDLLVSRIRSSVVDRIERLIADHGSYRGVEWLAGCRSAEEIVTATISTNTLLGVSSTPSQGQILRKMISQARKEQAHGYEVLGPNLLGR